MTARADRLRIRVLPDEVERWKAAAEAHGMAVSAWMRAMADEAAATGGNGREVATQLVGLRADLARGIGNNLNQLAHRANSGQHVEAKALADAARAVDTAMADVERAIRAIRPPKPRARP